MESGNDAYISYRTARETGFAERSGEPQPDPKHQAHGDEYRTVEKTSSADGKTTGEWLRDLTLRSLRSGANDTEIIALSEIVGVRLLLVNVLRSLGTGQRMTAEAYDKLVDEIGATKYDLAAKLIAERRR